MPLTAERLRPWVEFPLIGLVTGLLSGLLGVGGGLVMVPAMVLLLAIPQHYAHATSLAAIVPIALAGVLIFGNASYVDVSGGILLSVGGVVGVRVGARVMRRLDEKQLRVGFGVFLLVMAALMLAK